MTSRLSYGFDRRPPPRLVSGGRLVGVRASSGPAFEPVTGAEVEAHLHGTVPADQLGHLTHCITAARQALETLYDLAIMAQTIEARFLGPARSVRLPRLPLQDGDTGDITTITEIDEGSTTSKATGTYYLTGGGTGDVHLRAKQAGLVVPAGVELLVRYAAGFPSSSQAGTAADERAAVPPAVRMAVFKLTDDLYHDRGSYLVDMTIESLPTSLQLLMMEYRSYAL